MLTLLLAMAFDCRVEGQERAPKSPPQTPRASQQPEEEEVIRISTALVTVPVTVSDRNSRPLMSLQREQFHVFDNGREQRIAFFASVDSPFMVALLLDISDSTQTQLKLIQEAAIAFVDQLRPDDQVFVVAFDSRVRLLAQPKMNRDELRAAIRGLESGHGTSLYAVVEETIKQFPNSIAGRKAMVLLTDGIDTTSPPAMATVESSLRRAAESDVMVLPVQVNAPSELNPSDPGEAQIKLRFPGSASGPLVAASYARAREYLHGLASKTGAQFYAATDLKKLTEVFARVAGDLRTQYSLGYYPRTKPQPGEIREIKVSVDQPHVIVRSRASYVCCGAVGSPGNP